MWARFLLLLVAGLALWLLIQSGVRQPPQLAAPAGEVDPLPTVPAPAQPPQGRVADISVHSEEQLMLLFDRVEQLLDRPRHDGEEPLISLVLHGPEVEFFALQNYARYREVVDRAAKLAALGAVDISICQTQMRRLGIGTDEVPSFLRQVPYGPDEIERLLEEGYVVM